MNIDSLCTHLSALYGKNTPYYFRLAYGSSPNVEEDVFVSDNVINTALNYMLGWKAVQYPDIKAKGKEYSVDPTVKSAHIYKIELERLSMIDGLDSYSVYLGYSPLEDILYYIDF